MTKDERLKALELLHEHLRKHMKQRVFFESDEDFNQRTMDLINVGSFIRQAWEEDVYAVIRYKNHRDEIADRRCTMGPVRFGKSEYYPGEHWFLDVFDLDKREYRSFRIDHIESVTTENPQSEDVAKGVVP